MAPLEPFAPGRRVVAAVSGGADSTALALLLRGWGEPLAAVIDHGLRPEAAREAADTLDRLRALGVPARVVRLSLRPGPDLGARARAARYAALLVVCRSEGRPDLVLGHHARDQAETCTLRARAGSGPAGLAGMAAVAWRHDARLLRPLLPLPPERLRDTLRAAGVGWIEDPTNTDPATPRGALRGGLAQFLPHDPGAGAARQAAEHLLMAELAVAVTLHPAGFARVHGPLSPAAWSALVWAVSGQPYPPPRPGVARLVAAAGGTLHGVCLRDGWVFREPAMLPPPLPARAGTVWDRRFLLSCDVPSGEIGALDGDAAAMRRRPGPPLDALRGVPALRRGGKLLATPYNPFADAETCLTVPMVFRPGHVLAGAAFTPAECPGADGG